MNYLDVRNMGEAIEKRFAKFQRTVRVYTPLTTQNTLAFETVVFGQEDLQDIWFYLLSCNFIITTWSVHAPTTPEQLAIVTLYLSELKKNGQSAND